MHVITQNTLVLKFYVISVTEKKKKTHVKLHGDLVTALSVIVPYLI